MPSRAEREAHEATHLPYRSWCDYCVRGRAKNPPHSSVGGGEDRHNLMEVHLDYCFLRRGEGETLAKILVAKIRPSKAIRAWVVPMKGVSDERTLQRVMRDLRGMEVTPHPRAW